MNSNESQAVRPVGESIKWTHNVETKREYVARMARYPRSELLRALRFSRISAHRLRTNEQLAEVLFSLRLTRAQS